MLVYAATCAASLWLATRFLARIPVSWGIAIALLPLLVTGRAMVTGGHFGPLNLAYSVSPLSASGGFFGSRPFSRANDLLREQGADPIDWSLT